MAGKRDKDLQQQKRKSGEGQGRNTERRSSVVTQGAPDRVVMACDGVAFLATRGHGIA